MPSSHQWLRGRDDDEDGDHGVRRPDPAPPARADRHGVVADDDRPGDVHRRHRRELVGGEAVAVHRLAVDAARCRRSRAACAAARPAAAGSAGRRTSSSAIVVRTGRYRSRCRTNSQIRKTNIIVKCMCVVEVRAPARAADGRGSGACTCARTAAAGRRSKCVDPVARAAARRAYRAPTACRPAATSRTAAPMIAASKTNGANIRTCRCAHRAQRRRWSRRARRPPHRRAARSATRSARDHYALSCSRPHDRPISGLDDR